MLSAKDLHSGMPALAVRLANDFAQAIRQHQLPLLTAWLQLQIHRFVHSSRLPAASLAVRCVAAYLNQVDPLGKRSGRGLWRSLEALRARNQAG